MSDTQDLIDLLAAMEEYFSQRHELAKAREEYDGYSFDYFYGSQISDLERAYQRVQECWREAMT